MLATLLAAALAQTAASAPPPTLADASHALDAGRAVQARAIITRMVAEGVKGPAVDRLLAELAEAEGRSADALSLYEMLLARKPDDAQLAERAAISALKVGNVARGTALAEKATSLPGASWRAWNALGAAADLRQDWVAADAAYGRALALSPDSAEVLNNRGWSALLRGDWKAAAERLEQAVARAPDSRRMANNLELARSALAEDLPRRKKGESDTDWAARLNDAGVAARLNGDKARAVAAFAQAIETRGIWYERAWNNLKQAEAATQ